MAHRDSNAFTVTQTTSGSVSESLGLYLDTSGGWTYPNVGQIYQDGVLTGDTLTCPTGVTYTSTGFTGSGGTYTDACESRWAGSAGDSLDIWLEPGDPGLTLTGDQTVTVYFPPGVLRASGMPGTYSWLAYNNDDSSEVGTDVVVVPGAEAVNPPRASLQQFGPPTSGSCDVVADGDLGWVCSRWLQYSTTHMRPLPERFTR